MEAINSKIYLFLAIAAFLTVITGMIGQGVQWGWMQGVSIYVAMLTVIIVQAVNDLIKDKNFVKLQNEFKNEDISVIRGKKGVSQSINIYDLMVGDIILFETGSRIPADCLLVDGLDVVVDESFYSHSSERPKQKAS